MNIIKIQNQLKGVPDDTLVGYVQNPTGQVPTYLALSELQRRKEMRNSYQANKPEEKTVAEDLVQEAQPQPQMEGLAGLPEAQPMMEAMAPPPEMPMQQMAQGGIAELDTGDMFDEANYAQGGIVAFADGGDTEKGMNLDNMSSLDSNTAGEGATPLDGFVGGRPGAFLNLLLSQGNTGSAMNLNSMPALNVNTGSSGSDFPLDRLVGGRPGSFLDAVVRASGKQQGQGMAQGGEVQHYAYGGKTKTDPYMYDPSYYQDAQAALMKPRDSIALDDYILQQQTAQRQLGVDPEFYKKTLEESKTERLKELEDAKKMDQAQLLLAYGSAFAGTPTFGKALEKGGEKAGAIIGSMGKTQREINSLYKMADRKTLEAQQSQARGDASAAMKAIDDRDNINTQIGMKNAELETSVRIAGYKARADKSGKAYEIFDKAKDNAQKEFEKDYPDAARKVEFSGPDGAAKESLVKKQYIEKNLKILMGDIEGAYGTTPTVTKPAMPSMNGPVTNPDGTVTIPGKGTFKKLPNGNYEKIT